MEIGMIRLASFVTLALLAVAAGALLATCQSVAEEPLQDNSKEPTVTPRNRFLTLAAEGSAPFHARFSLN
jgi:hypothetical protein